MYLIGVDFLKTKLFYLGTVYIDSFVLMVSKVFMP